MKKITLIAAIFILVAGCSGPTQSTTPIIETPKEGTSSVKELDHPTTSPTKPPTQAPNPTPTTISLPTLTLESGDFYFSMDGQQSFIFSRNLAGNERSQYYQLLDLTNTGGSKFVRVQLDSFGMGYSNTGEVDDAWAKKWEDIFEKAALKGIYILPTFSAWYDWNNGNGYSTWKSNPFNEVNGGPAMSPAELFISNSPTQNLWLGWMKKLIERWQGQKNIIGWEPFSEVNMVPGTTEIEAIGFVNSAASIIDNTDSFHRPVTTSLADFGNWTGFYRNDSLEFINIHPYPVSGKLDTAILTEVRSMLAIYHKPVLIGESGLSFLTPDTDPPTLTTADRADIGIKHAIWAATVSGAMNGRALWWEDGVAIYFPSLSWTFLNKYSDIELPAVNFVRGIDYTGFKPLTATSTGKVWGAAVGNENSVIGWYRDAQCEPPDWEVRPIAAGQTVTLTVAGSSQNWQVDFYDTKTGTTLLSAAAVTRQGGTITVTLPAFEDDIAFKMVARGGTASAATAMDTTNPIAGEWRGTISSQDGTFSTQLELSIEADCRAGQVCGSFTVPQLPCSGDLFLQTNTAGDYIFIEQNVSGAAYCVSGGYEQLTLQTDGTMMYEYWIRGSADRSSGVLEQR